MRRLTVRKDRGSDKGMTFLSRIFAVLIIIMGFCSVSHSFAQDVHSDSNENIVEHSLTELSEGDSVAQRMQLKKPQVDLNQIPSLFLTINEESLIEDAKRGFLTRPPTEREFENEQNQAQTGNASRPSSVREISLGGILYSGPQDWSIWLNSQKITPQNIPPAILDIDVTKDKVTLRWLDFQTNQIFPVKLRTHQRFNFDSRMFLPGTSSIEDMQ